MAVWRPKLKTGVDVTRLDLSGEEGFVLSRIDGATDVRNLQHLTGLDEGRLQRALDRLIEAGAVEAPAATDAGSSMGGGGIPRASDVARDLDDPPEELAIEGDGDAHDDVQDATHEDASADASEDTPALDEAAARTYRQLFESELHPLPRDQRVERARVAEGPTLTAFCFDPDPGVIRSVLENLHVGLEHARLIAAHHRHALGLDALSRRAAFLRDGQVQRRLLQNPQCSDALTRRLLQGKHLSQLFQLSKSREMTERAKRNVRQSFRAAFQRAEAEERVGLVLSTEGRCLAALVGLSLDSKTAALLSGRSYNSSLLIQNLARWPATPPILLTHLFKQPALRRAPHLRQLVLQHPNCPSQLKRQGT